MKKITLLLLSLLSGLLLIACSAEAENNVPPTEPPPTATPTRVPTATPIDTTGFYRTEREVLGNLAYIEDGNPYQRLDLYLPIVATEEDTYPVVMLIRQHGIDKRHETLVSLAKLLADHGIAVISLDYRDGGLDPFPDNVSDGICALGWVYQNAAQYNFDVDQIFLVGYLTGGVVAGFMGTVDSYDAYSEDCVGAIPADASLAGVITFSGVFDLPILVESNPDLDDYFAELVGGHYAEIPEVWEEASPITWVNGNEPEFLLLRGENEQDIVITQSAEFLEKLEATGGTGEIHVFPRLRYGQLITSSSAFEVIKDYVIEKTAP